MPDETPNTIDQTSGRQTLDDKVQIREGNSPNSMLRSQRRFLSGKEGLKTITTSRLAWKQLFFKEIVVDH